MQDYRHKQTRRFEVVIFGYVDGGVLVLEEDFVFDDWLYRQDERHLFNLTKMTKLGVEVGQITCFFKKLNNLIDGGAYGA